MADPIYTSYNDDYFQRDNLLENKEFLKDAKLFLVDRGGYDYEEISDDQDAYDAYMEHFRSQNVNEVTAARDYMYAQNANDDSKRRMARLMTTFERMQSDLGLDAVGDYFEGIITAPSTYAGLASFGAGKLGAKAVQQGIKLGIKELLKRGALTTGVGTAVVEGVAGAATTAAQEGTRVETGVKEEVDVGAIATSGAISGAIGFGVGSLSGAFMAKRGGEAEAIFKSARDKVVANVRQVHENITAKDLKKKGFKKKFNKTKDKLALKETVPDFLGRGQDLRAGDPEYIEVVDKINDNIIAAVTKSLDKLKEPLAEGERITSRFARELADTNSDFSKEFRQIATEYGLTARDISSIFVAEASEAGRTLGMKGRLSQIVNKGEFIDDLSRIDAALNEYQGGLTEAAREAYAKGTQNAVSQTISNISRARVGLLTTQVATTVRNTTTGVLRNYFYALDNIGTGAYRVMANRGGTLSSDEAVQQTAKNAVRLGQAELKAGVSALFPKDLFFGGTVEAQALKKVLSDPLIGNSDIGQRMFRELADIGVAANETSGLIKISAKLNALNRYSDNMFKRAIFAREMDKKIRAAGQGTLKDYLAEGKLADLDAKFMQGPMEESMAFTYQLGSFRGKEGAFNSLAAGYIDAMSTPIGSLITPFPRYMVNQFKFFYEHAPILGMFDVEGILNKSDIATRFGKQITGWSAIGAFLGLKEMFSDEYTDTWELVDPATKDIVNVQSLVGPFGGLWLFSDIWHRYMNGKIRPFDFENFVEALSGGDYRAGQGADLINAAFFGVTDDGAGFLSDTEKLKLTLAKFSGETASGFTMPLAVFKDVVGVVDKDFRVLPDETDINFFEYFFKQATKNVPKGVGEDGLVSEWFFDGVEMPEDLKTGAMYGPTRSGPIYNVDPLREQVMGMSRRPAKSPYEEQLAKHGIKWREYVPRKLVYDPQLNNELKQVMGSLVQDRLNSFVGSDTYRNLPPEDQALQLKAQIGLLKSEARERVLDENRMDQRVFRQRFLSMPSTVKKWAEAKYTAAYGAPDFDEERVWETLYVIGDMAPKGLSK